jgi:serine/threonine protein kinase
MPEPNTERDLLEVLAEEFIERQRRGECPSISEYAQQHPQLAGEIRDLFPTIAAMERLKVQKEQSHSARASLGGLHLERLGDFRIIREIGRGGMGIVFEAEQESLGRRVAIKVLPRSSLLATSHLQRFEREARIAAGLHHTNIVSVFGVGECEGLHYYVMQYIPGMALDRSLARLSKEDRARGCPDETVVERSTDASGEELNDSPAAGQSLELGSEEICRPLSLGPALAGVDYWRSVARIGIQAAEALAYAHAQGTLHCDIKPANLLVDRHGVVWITDFGVAKAMQFEDLTRTGDVTGTLQYIAPERFQGQTDARSDLYSLGLTLYELLTLRPAFDEPDRQRLIRRILEGSPVPPRRLNPSIPRDLETIVLKALARDPGHRYSSAGALAEDLQRYLEDRPILARRITAAERLWRWCRRNPGMAGLSTAVAILLLLVAVVASIGYLHAKQANVLVRQALEGERQQRQRAETNSKLALGVLDRIYTQLAPSRSPGSPELTVQGSEGGEIAVSASPAVSRETAALLENLLGFYDRIAAQSGDNEELRLQTARANRRVADIQAHLGQFVKARAAYRRTLEMYCELQTQPGVDSVGLAREIAAVQTGWGDLERATTQLQTAYQAYQAAIKILEPLATSTAPPEVRYELACTYASLGTLVRRGLGPANPGPGGGPHHPRPGPGGPDHDGPPPKPEREGQLGPPAPMGESSGPPPFGPPPMGPPEGRFAGPPKPPHEPLLPVAPGFDRHTEDLYLSRAIDLLEALRREHPSKASYRHLLACCYRDRSRGPNRRDAEAIEQAVGLLEQLVREFPQVFEYRRDLAETYAMLAQHHEAAGPRDSPAVDQYVAKAQAICDQLSAELPADSIDTASLVPTLYTLAEVQLRHGRRDDADRVLRKALSLQTSLARHFPEVTTHQLWMVIVQDALAGQLQRQGRLSDARSILEDAVKTLAALDKNASDLPHVRRLLGENYLRLAGVLTEMGEEGPAAAARQQAHNYRPPHESKR